MRVLTFLLLACAPEEEDVPQLLGTIEARDAEAEVWDTTTMFYAEDDTMFLFMSIVEGASCEETGDFLAGELESAESAGPAAFKAPDSCTLTLNTANWDGSLQVDVEEGDVTAEVALSVSCWMDGEWVLGEAGWTFDGKYWNGAPTAFSLEVTGDEDGGAYAIEMESYTGSDPYDFSMPVYPGEGLVKGEGNAEWCADLEDTPIFD